MTIYPKQTKPFTCVNVSANAILFGAETPVIKFSFPHRTINVWNKLLTECVHASSVNMFKNRIDKYLVNAGYT